MLYAFLTMLLCFWCVLDLFMSSYALIFMMTVLTGASIHRIVYVLLLLVSAVLQFSQDIVKFMVCRLCRRIVVLRHSIFIWLAGSIWWQWWILLGVYDFVGWFIWGCCLEVLCLKLTGCLSWWVAKWQCLFHFLYRLFQHVFWFDYINLYNIALNGGGVTRLMKLQWLLLINEV